MTTGLQLMILAGALVGLGLALVAARVWPAHPDLADALDRLSPTHARPATVTPAGPTSRQERLGLWAIRVLPPALWVRTPTRELALLEVSVARFRGKQLLAAGFGLVLPALATFYLSLVGLSLPIPVPAIACLALAVAMFFLPTRDVLDEARKARVEYTRALATYIDLVALERRAGSGTRQAMEAAAQVAGSRVFTRLSEELARSRWSGLPPWEALHGLGDELGLPALDELADIMRLSGEEGTSVYHALRARSAAMRTALLHQETAEANAIGERMTIPGALLGVIFMALVIAPHLYLLFAAS